MLKSLTYQPKIFRDKKMTIYKYNKKFFENSCHVVLFINKITIISINVIIIISPHIKKTT